MGMESWQGVLGRLGNYAPGSLLCLSGSQQSRHGSQQRRVGLWAQG